MNSGNSAIPRDLNPLVDIAWIPAVPPSAQRPASFPNVEAFQPLVLEYPISGHSEEAYATRLS